jgi:hypothetical protein
VPQRFERLQQFLHVGPAGAVEVLGDLFNGQRLVGVRHDGLDHLRAGLEVARPVERFRRRSIAANVKVEIEFGLCFDRLGGLVLRAEVADMALLFLGPPLGVEANQSLQDRLLGQPRVPAVRIGDGGIQLVMQFFEDANEALLVDLALRFVQSSLRRSFLSTL